MAKVERTKTQIDTLNVEIRKFIDASSYEIVSKIDTERDEEIWSFRLKREIPMEISVIIGEILHNLRSSLDQMACAIALRHSGSFKETYFPFGADATIFESELARKGKKLPSDAADMIRTLKPYKGGNDLLWFVHDLNRTDKHIDLTPVNLCTSANKMTYLTIVRGFGLTIGSRAGQHLNAVKQRPSAAEIAAFPSPSGVYNMGTFPGHLRFGTAGCTPEESLNFMVTTPGTEFKTDMQPTIDIAFQNIEGLELKPVVAVLNQMRELIERVLLAFRNRFL